MQFTPFEGFILSRLDGVASLEDIADSTGATLEQVEAVIARLEAIGRVAWVEHGRSTSRASRPPPLRLSAPPHPSVEATRPEPRAADKSETKSEGLHETKPTATKTTATENESRRGETTKPAPERLSRPSGTPSRGIVRTKPPPPDTPRQLYDPVELEEPGVDLDSDRRREILDTFYRLGHLDHYQLLGLEREADKKDIREAYFRLSKLFHPDTLYGKGLGSYKVKMEAVFRRLTDAYDVLGKAKKRDRYDDYLRAKDLSDRVRRGLADGESKAAKLEREAREAVAEAVVEPRPTAARPMSSDATRPTVGAGPRPASTPPPSPAATPNASTSRDSTSPPAGGSAKSSASTRPASVPPTRTSLTVSRTVSSSSSTSSTASPRPPATPKDAAPSSGPSRPTSVAVPRAPLDDGAKRQLARDLLERRLKGATGRTTSTSSTSSLPAAVPAEHADKDALLRGLASSLRQAARVTAGGDRVDRHVREARGAEQRGDLVAAVNSLRLATSLSPERDELVHELERVRHLLAKSLAMTYERQARYEEENGEYAAAARSWIKVAEGRPERYVYPMHAAMAFLKANTELKLAKDLAERAVLLAPDVARVRAVLAEIFLRAGMGANAKRELDAAAKLDPEADFVKNLQRELK